MALAEAMKAERSNARELWQGLRGLSGYQGVTGVIQFDEQGNVGPVPAGLRGRGRQARGDGAGRRQAPLASLERTTGTALAPVAVQLLH